MMKRGCGFACSFEYLEMVNHLYIYYQIYIYARLSHEIMHVNTSINMGMNAAMKWISVWISFNQCNLPLATPGTGTKIQA